MPRLEVDLDLLRAFEDGLDPYSLAKSAVPARVLGYGEISTVFEIGSDRVGEVAYKRLPMFETDEEAARYEILYHEYVQILRDRVGLRVAQSETVRFRSSRGRVLLYIVQEKFPPEVIGHKVIQRLSSEVVLRLVRAVLQETRKVFAFNRQHMGELEIGFDGQISNWALTAGYDPQYPASGRAREIALTYFDTSTPLMKKRGDEQLDPELFLRNAPSFLAWVIRLFFLEDVMNRYYSSRKVAVDLVANFYKEQRSDLVPSLVDVVNDFHLQDASFKSLTIKEIAAYYREDAWIWRIYLAARKIDRFVNRLLGRDYPYILPGKIKR